MKVNKQFITFTKSNQESCVEFQVPFAVALDQTEGNFVPYYLQFPELQPYYHSGNSNLVH